jgi:hypothetical protein
LVDLGGRRRGGVIRRLRRLLSSARPGQHDDSLGKRPGGRARAGEGGDAARRIEAAQRRLKATIPPPEE